MHNINYFGLFKELRYIFLTTIISVIGVATVIFVYNHTGIYGAIFFALILFLAGRLLVLGANPDNRPPFDNHPQHHKDNMVHNNVNHGNANLNHGNGFKDGGQNKDLVNKNQNGNDTNKLNQNSNDANKLNQNKPSNKPAHSNPQGVTGGTSPSNISTNTSNNNSNNTTTNNIPGVADKNNNNPRNDLSN